jgi:hypothetical protein
MLSDRMLPAEAKVIDVVVWVQNSTVRVELPEGIEDQAQESERPASRSYLTGGRGGSQQVTS